MQQTKSQADKRGNKNSTSPQVRASTDRVLSDQNGGHSPDKAHTLREITLMLGTLADAAPIGFQTMAAIISETHDSFIEKEKGKLNAKAGPIKQLREALWNMESDLAALDSLFDMIVKDMRCRHQDEEEDSRVSTTKFEHREHGLMRIMERVHGALESQWSSAWMATGGLDGHWPLKS